MAKKQKILAKKTTKQLFEAIDSSLDSGHYYFTNHGEYRSKTRKKVNDLEVLMILKSKTKRHEAIRDKLDKGRKDWNYHIRGKNSDMDDIRISLSFDLNLLLIITVINLDEEI